ncbi:hypothetical protein B0T25DRAFT_263755 [Lasiosphaeria hispida]|uniref:Uncharacterized protein n=1 Tax=Lasiosphaeria hispida TaxID=260671 RepID=A0AAJ0HGB0_9PEZI|nr:hypothetical protein B0T25DRAFT_263755 [Lasiosphaeria hispida]
MNRCVLVSGGAGEHHKYDKWQTHTPLVLPNQAHMHRVADSGLSTHSLHGVPLRSLGSAISRNPDGAAEPHPPRCRRKAAICANLVAPTASISSTYMRYIVVCEIEAEGAHVRLSVCLVLCGRCLSRPSALMQPRWLLVCEGTVVPAPRPPVPNSFGTLTCSNGERTGMALARRSRCWVPCRFAAGVLSAPASHRSRRKKVGLQSLEKRVCGRCKQRLVTRCWPCSGSLRVVPGVPDARRTTGLSQGTMAGVALW